MAGKLNPALTCLATWRQRKQVVNPYGDLHLFTHPEDMEQPWRSFGVVFLAS